MDTFAFLMTFWAFSFEFLMIFFFAFKAIMSSDSIYFLVIALPVVRSWFLRILVLLVVCVRFFLLPALLVSNLAIGIAALS